MKKKVLVAMSGGVDSSTAAHLLKKEGFDVAGITMCLGVKETRKPRPACCGEGATADAKKVCWKLGIPHYMLDFSKHLEKRVIERFVSEYSNGRTPNPCVDCNKSLKFDILLKKALSLGFDFLATGHYAKIEKEKNSFLLKKAKDKTKDQSYFLYCIRKSALKSILFPLSGLTKTEVRAIAKVARLPVHDKPQSQDICFIPERNYHGFLSERIAQRIEGGPILSLDGDFLGKHKGACFYTVGQRGGLGVGHKHPLYVLSVNAEKNELIVGKKDDLKSAGLVAGEVNLLVEDMPRKVSAKIRYNQEEAGCSVTLLEKGRKLKVTFENAQEAVTPGQSIVLYDGETVLGGGVIEKTIDR